jgi:hypothetical protein
VARLFGDVPDRVVQNESEPEGKHCAGTGPR